MRARAGGAKTRRRTRDGRGATQDSAQRLQKVLAQHGVGSRRQVEQWIAEGRIKVNGRTAVTGQPVTARDRVVVDGRDVSRLLTRDAERRVIVYHKTSGEMLKRRAGDERPSVTEHLPALHGGRWVAINALGFAEDGLLILSSDGRFASALGRRARELPVEYRVRALRPRESLEWPKMPLDVEVGGKAVQFQSAEPVGIGGTNQWFRVEAAQGLPRGAVQALFDSAGLKVSRTMLVRWGPMSLPRDLPRGRSRDLEDPELAALLALTGTRNDVQ